MSIFVVLVVISMKLFKESVVFGIILSIDGDWKAVVTVVDSSAREKLLSFGSDRGGRIVDSWITKEGAG